MDALIMPIPLTPGRLELRRHVEGRLIGLRVNRYSWWVHARELADYFLPRRYKFLITPNMMSRGSPINQHMLDSTGTLAARNLSSGMMSGVSSPTRQWFKLKIGHIDSTQTSPISLWLAECERLMMLVMQESNFYQAMAVVYFDLVIFGTACILIYEDPTDVIRCFTPCFGEFYVDNDGMFRPLIFYREFTLTIDQLVDCFGFDNVSPAMQRQYETGQKAGAQLTRELVVAHAIEPNNDAYKYEFPDHFKYRECYWEWGGSASPQGGSSFAPGFLSLRGFNEAPHIIVRWDLVSNDAYGRSPAMDALGDVKQLQQEVRRKAQAIDKHVNPPMVADIQLKNQPASMLPGGVTYVTGMTTGKVGFAPAYTVNPDIQGMLENLNECRERIKETFFNNLFQTISQFETRSNVSATEIDARRAESLVSLGQVLERIEYELLSPIVERVFAVMSRARILPQAPPEIQGLPINVEFISMLATAQAAAATGGIERLLQVAGSLVGIDPAVMDNIDIDFTLDKYSELLNNDPRLIRTPAQLAQIRAQRQHQQAYDQQAARAEQL